MTAEFQFARWPIHVMAGHGRSKNGVASLAYDPAIHVLLATKKDVDARHEAGHDGGEFGGRTRLARNTLGCVRIGS
jgi:hypothetical protein